MKEWRDIIGYEGRYEVSSEGDIRTIPHFIEQMFKGQIKQRRVRARDRKLQKHNLGYSSVVLGKDNMQLVHRLVAQAFLPKIEGKDFVNHKNGNKKDNRVENLEWCTRQENEDHAYGTGLKNSTGSHNQMAKITEGYAKAIKQLAETGWSTKELSEVFGLHIVNIRRIVRGKTWKHVNLKAA